MPREEIFRKFKAGTLHSGSKTGPKVKDRKQAVAIAMSYKPEHKAKGGMVGGMEGNQTPASMTGATSHPPPKRGGRQPVGRNARAVPKSKGGFKVNMGAYKSGGVVC